MRYVMLHSAWPRLPDTAQSEEKQEDFCVYAKQLKYMLSHP